MSLITRFRAINDDDKAALVRRLMQYSTPDFDYFYLMGLSMAMATLGLLLDSTAIVIGSMLIAPLMYPILSTALGIVMMNPLVLGRSLYTLGQSLFVSVSIAMLTALFFAEDDATLSSEVLQRIDPSALHLLVALVAGAAVSYVLTQPEWSDTLPGVAIAVALIPPLGTTGVGLALGEVTIIMGAATILALNLLGIIGAAITLFFFMDIGQKQQIAVSTIRQETKKVAQERKKIASVDKERTAEKEQASRKNT
jgi:uncharacterized hydrophobic protein (TIGR00271 family)